MSGGERLVALFRLRGCNRPVLPRPLIGGPPQGPDSRIRPPDDCREPSVWETVNPQAPRPPDPSPAPRAAGRPRQPGQPARAGDAAVAEAGAGRVDHDKPHRHRDRPGHSQSRRRTAAGGVNSARARIWRGARARDAATRRIPRSRRRVIRRDRPRRRGHNYTRVAPGSSPITYHCHTRPRIRGSRSLPPVTSAAHLASSLPVASQRCDARHNHRHTEYAWRLPHVGTPLPATGDLGRRCGGARHGARLDCDAGQLGIERRATGAHLRGHPPDGRAGA